MQHLTSLFTQTFASPPASINQLKGAGSNRQYFRLTATDGKTVIGVVGTSVEENEAFIHLARHFREKGLRVPEVFAVSDDKLRYLQQDLGSRSLFDALKNGRESGGNYSDYEKSLLRRVIAELPRLQTLGAQDLDFSVCYPQPEFDEDNVLFDLNYFKYCFLKPSALEFNEVKLQQDFKALAKDLTTPAHPFPTAPSSVESTFMYRDFQARNIMLDHDDNPWFIDFQGGRKGPGIYDLVSFLWQASAKYPQELREELIQVYFENLEALETPKSRNLETPQPQNLKSSLPLFVLFRLLQTLGAYGFRGYFERKQHFIQSIPPALANLKALLAQGACDTLPYLKQTLNSLVGAVLVSARATEQNVEPFSKKTGGHEVHPYNGQPSLVVRIFSFSYKKGIPEDTSGNGGGYVFDCRSTHNPGRYEEYKKLTGLDKPIIDFLEDNGEILDFLDSVYKLADFHVQRYLDRGFTDLMFSFGCTGGQHRSVYSAQHLAEHLHQKFGITVHLCHREQNIKQTLGNN